MHLEIKQKKIVEKNSKTVLKVDKKKNTTKYI